MGEPPLYVGNWWHGTQFTFQYISLGQSTSTLKFICQIWKRSHQFVSVNSKAPLSFMLNYYFLETYWLLSHFYSISSVFIHMCVYFNFLSWELFPSFAVFLI